MNTHHYSGWGNTCVITVDHGDIIVRYCEVGNVVAISGFVTRGHTLKNVWEATDEQDEPAKDEKVLADLSAG